MSGIEDQDSAWLLDVAQGRAAGPPSDSLRLLELAYRHGLIGLVADQASPAFWPRSAPIYARLAARQQVMLYHLRALAELFSANGIPLAVLKGPWLRECAYERPQHRTFSDLDLLVPREALGSALTLIQEHGRLPSIPRQRPEADKREIPLTDPSGVTFAVDLHWDMFSYGQLRGRARAATDEGWRDSWQRKDPPLANLWQLSAPATWSFLSCHAIFDHRFRLILFRDLAELARTPPDWEELVDFASRNSLRTPVHLALSLAKRWVGADIPAKVIADLRVRSFVLHATHLLSEKADPVTFDGHRPHPLNLAIVLVHDERRERLRLLARAPWAVPGWLRKVRARPRVVDRPRAVIVVAGTRRRGAEVFGEQLAQGLSDAGWQSDLVALTRSPYGPEITAEVVNTGGAPLPRFGLRSALRLRRHLKALGPDIVLANGSATLKYTAAALVGLRRRPAFVYASVGEPRYWTRTGLRSLFQRLLLSRTDQILAVSAETARQLVEHLHQPSERVSVAETGVPAEFLNIGRNGFHPELRILVLGSLSDEKDPLKAIDVVAELSKRHQAVLRFVGAGPLATEVQEHAAGLEVAVDLVGAVSDVGPALAWADVLLLTSRTEGLPGAVLEAGAAGVPAVGFSVGGVAEAIIDGETGFVVPPGDVATAAAALAQLAEDPDLVTRMGDAARRHVASR
ncbi:MAG TPA: nucleotidyltransferase family protein, partial [Acidimicrobiia bacterium]|nr:nucleotidyltransferase family protein [Acidimicrobiia bacterium]